MGSIAPARNAAGQLLNSFLNSANEQFLLPISLRQFRRVPGFVLIFD